MRQGRGILTIAFGAPRYVRMAKTLARSLQLHAPDLPRAVVTDSSDDELRRLFPTQVSVRPEFGAGVAQKLSIYEYTPFEETLFLDADSIVVRPLDAVWDLFTDVSVGVVGTSISSGRWFMDVAATCRRLCVPSIPKFNGGLYYFRDDATARRVFESAQGFLPRYEEFGLGAFRGGVNDEPLMAMALAVNGVPPVADGGAAMRTPIGLEGRLVIDVLRARSRFVKKGKLVSPAIVHFAGDYANGTIYRREQAKLCWAGSSQSWNWLVSRLCHLVYLVDCIRGEFRHWLSSWWRRERRAWRELTSRTPEAATVVLIDDNQWSPAGNAGARTILPFLEHDGHYWGVPADDRTAIRELERLRREGATHLAIGWPAFWWLEHFARFAAQLDERYICTCATSRLVLYDLATG